MTNKAEHEWFVVNIEAAVAGGLDVDNVKRFEAQYGNIKDQETTAMPFNFGAPTAQA